MNKPRYDNEKSRIIDVAITLIHREGLASFRIDALCEQLGYTRQNIYRYYPSKKAILNAAVVESSCSLARSIADMLADMDAPFDEQMIEGILIACDIIHRERKMSSLGGKDLASSTQLFMENAQAVQDALLGFLQPVYEEARIKGEMYDNMSYEELTRWLFQIFLSQIISSDYESRESREAFLLKMFSPSVNAQKANDLCQNP